MVGMNQYHAHQQLVRSFMSGFQKAFPSARIFQRHVGLFFTKNKTPVRINLPGMADLWALIPHGGVCLHFEFEIKTGAGRQSKEQKSWQAVIESLGASYLVVRDVDESLNQINLILSKMPK